jgi:hypothetical protein
MSESTPDAELYGIDPEEFGPETIEGEHPPLDEPDAPPTRSSEPATDAGPPGDRELASETEVEPAD